LLTVLLVAPVSCGEVVVCLSSTLQQEIRTGCGDHTNANRAQLPAIRWLHLQLGRIVEVLPDHGFDKFDTYLREERSHDALEKYDCCTEFAAVSTI
jgi:hypothetical protein